MNHNEKIDLLEEIIDDHSLCGLMELIAEVCSTKADHILSSYDDEETANIWDGYAAGFLLSSLSPDKLPQVKQQ